MAWVSSLGFTTIPAAGSEVTVEHGLEFHPAAPEDEPAGMPVTLAVLVAAEPTQGEEELVDRQVITDLAITRQAQDLDVLGGQHRVGAAHPGVVAAARLAQVQERHRHH